MNEPHEFPLSVTEDQLFAIIGRLHVENLALRAQVAAMRQNAAPVPLVPVADACQASNQAAGYTMNMASPNE